MGVSQHYLFEARQMQALSLAVHVTVVTPLTKIDPLAGLHTTVALPQLSVAVGAM